VPAPPSNGEHEAESGYSDEDRYGFVAVRQPTGESANQPARALSTEDVPSVDPGVVNNNVNGSNSAHPFDEIEVSLLCICWSISPNSKCCTSPGLLRLNLR
jgi:hypothetical protein